MDSFTLEFRADKLSQNDGN